MPQLNGILVEHLLLPLQRLRKQPIVIVDCLNYGTTYPKFFNRVENDPRAYYVFVIRGNFMNVPDERHPSKAFQTTCPGVNLVANDNVMVVSVCSSYMYSIRLGTIPRCSTSCKVAEGLFNLWSSSSGQGSRERIPPAFSFVDALATDACQLDDFMIGVIAAVVTKAGLQAQIYTADKRFYEKKIELPRIYYPFYLVVHTEQNRVGIPVYQRDSKILYDALNNSTNPSHFRKQGSWPNVFDTERKMNERKTQWRDSRALAASMQQLHARVQATDASHRHLESPVSGYEESVYSDPISRDDHLLIEKEAFAEMEGGENPDCDRVTQAPTMGRMSLQDLQRIAAGATSVDAEPKGIRKQ